MEIGKKICNIYVLSEGRTICGLGIDWSKDEYQVSNIPFKERGKREDKFIQTLKRIRTDDVVEFKGKFCIMPASKIGPIRLSSRLSGTNIDRPFILKGWDSLNLIIMEIKRFNLRVLV